MSKQQHWIIDWLNGKGLTSPTAIGEAYEADFDEDGFGVNTSPSAWASPKCLSLVKGGWLERSRRGWYRLAQEPPGRMREQTTAGRPPRLRGRKRAVAEVAERTKS